MKKVEEEGAVSVKPHPAADKNEDEDAAPLVATETADTGVVSVDNAWNAAEDVF